MKTKMEELVEHFANAPTTILVGPLKEKPMTFDQYHYGVLNTLRRTDNLNEDVLHMAFGLCEEAGELAGKFKRKYRGDGGSTRESVLAELGDVLWYADALAHLLDSTLEEVAAANLEKLASRKARGVLTGSGDNR